MLPDPRADRWTPARAGRARRAAGAGWLALTILLVAALFRPDLPEARAQDAAMTLPCPGNRLANPGFEEGFAARGDLGRVLARGWLAWQDASPRTPQLLPVSRARDGDSAAQAGLWSQALRDLGPLQAGGLWQRVEVPAGERLGAHAWARAWAGRASDRRVSRPAGRYLLSLGIDPRGGSDPAAEGLVWTEPITITDTWLPLFLETTAEAGTVSLFLRGQPLEALSNEVRWDAVCLRLADAPLPPRPSSTPSPPSTRDPADGGPTETPSLPTLEAEVRAQAAATGRAIDLAMRATQRAATPPALRQPRPASASAPAGSGGGPAPGVSQATPDRVPWWVRAYDHAGLVALALAALAAGLLAGLGRLDRGARA